MTLTLTSEAARKFGHAKPKDVLGSITEVELTPEQVTWWNQTRTKCLTDAPGFTFILYQMMNPRRSGQKAVFTRQVPIAGTDGLYALLNPDKFFDNKVYNLKNRVFILAHEVCHAILNHAMIYEMYRDAGVVRTMTGKSLPYVEEYMQMSGDYIINDMLVESKIGETPKDALHEPGFISHKDSIVQAYEKVYKREETQKKQQNRHQKAGQGNRGSSQPGSSGGQGNQPGSSQSSSPGQGQGQGNSQPTNPQGFDVVLKPGAAEGKSPVQASGERDGQEWKTAVASAMAQAKAQGLLSASMQRLFEEVLEPRVSWEDHIIGWFHRKLGGGSYDFRRPDRPMLARGVLKIDGQSFDAIYAPSRAGYGAEVVVVAVDTSGSVGDKTIAMFLGEVAGILGDVRPRDLYVVWCDAKVHRVDMPEDVSDLREMRAKGAPGGGGTDFRPVFDWVKETGLRPDTLLYLTDMMGTFPQVEPEYPTLWGSITPDIKAPWGEVVDIPNADLD